VKDFVAALGLVLVIEGVCSAAFPTITKAAMLTAAQTPSPKLRIVGIIAAVVGVGIVWLVRG
jgi:uncharacterized protein YjeT (DUF2065 family)